MSFSGSTFVSKFRGTRGIYSTVFVIFITCFFAFGPQFVDYLKATKEPIWRFPLVDKSSEHNDYGGKFNSPNGAKDEAFAVLREDGSIFVWGEPKGIYRKKGPSFF